MMTFWCWAILTSKIGQINNSKNTCFTCESVSFADQNVWWQVDVVWQKFCLKLLLTLVISKCRKAHITTKPSPTCFFTKECTRCLGRCLETHIWSQAGEKLDQFSCHCPGPGTGQGDKPHKFHIFKMFTMEEFWSDLSPESKIHNQKVCFPFCATLPGKICLSWGNSFLAVSRSVDSSSSST